MYRIRQVFSILVGIAAVLTFFVVTWKLLVSGIDDIQSGWESSTASTIAWGIIESIYAATVGMIFALLVGLVSFLLWPDRPSHKGPHTGGGGRPHTKTRQDGYPTPYHGVMPRSRH